MANHPIVHVEISSKDHARMKDFYGKLFGWSFQDYPDMNYVTFNTGQEQTGGGFNPVSDQLPAGTVVFYVHTDNIDDTLARATALGAKIILPKMEVPGVGHMAWFADPSSNQIAVLQPAGQM